MGTTYPPNKYPIEKVTVAAQSAPPKPAHDAMREGLQQLIDRFSGLAKRDLPRGGVRLTKSEQRTADARFVVDECSLLLAALAAPVLSPDGAVNPCPICGINNNSPFPCEHAFPSPTGPAQPRIGDLTTVEVFHAGAEEPAAFAWTIPGSDQADCNGFIPTKVVREGEFTKPLYASPTVRGDRETIAEMLKRNGFTSRDGTATQGGTFGIIDAILETLHVQPGAGERETALIERCAKIAEPWPGFSLDEHSTDVDRAVVAVRTEIAEKIRAVRS